MIKFIKIIYKYVYLNNPLIAISLLYFVTRLPFIRLYPLLFDSFEYLERAQRMNIGNFQEIISSSHQPIHTFYLLTLFIAKQIFSFLPISSLMVLLSIVFGYLTLIYWYRFVRIYTDNKTAFYSSVLVLFFPLFFVVNTNIMYESELLFFQVAGLYYFFIAVNKNSLKIIIVSGILWGVSQSIFIGSLILLPIYLSVLLIGRRKKIIVPILFILTAVATNITIDLLIFQKLDLLVNKYASFVYVPNYDKNYGLVIFLLRVLRNLFFHPIVILSVSGFIILLISLLIILRKNKRQFFLFIIWLSPSLILTQYWGAWLLGRLAIFLTFTAALIVSTAVRNKYLKLFILILLSATTGYYMIKQCDKPPLYKSFSLIKEGDKRSGIAVLTSDYNRFLYVLNDIPIYIFRGFNEAADEEKEFILRNLAEGKKVLIDSSGLRFPYYQFDSDFFQVLSMGKIGTSQGSKVLSELDFNLYAQDQSNKDIYFFELISPLKEMRKVQAKIFYPKSLYYISQNKPYKYDPSANLFYLILKKKDPEYWWYE